MTELEETLRRYIANRAGLVNQNEADTVVARAASARAARRGPARHLLNAGAAVTLVLALIATGIVVQMQLRGLRTSVTTTGGGPVPPVPNEVVDFQESPGLVLPFRLRDGKLLPARAQWILAPGTALMLNSGSSCDETVIHVVDLGSPPHDLRSPVSFPDCYDSPVILPGSEVLLAHFRQSSGNPFEDLGAVRYDWSTGRITKSYPGLSGIRFAFVGGLASRDGNLLYTLSPDFCNYCALDITDLRTGARLANAPIYISTSNGFNAGGMALSLDGQTLYVNEGDKLATFDATTGKVGKVVSYNGRPTASSSWPWWLPSMTSADAKEGFGPGRGIAIDPKGRWVAVMGADDPHDYGIWLFTASGPLHLLRRIEPISGLSGIAVSRDGSVLYAYERQAQQGSLYVIDPQTGRVVKRYADPVMAGFLGIATVEAG